MDWVLGANKEIAVDANQITARSAFIQRVTGADVSPWQPVYLNGAIRFFVCSSADTVDGAFITAHNLDVFRLCELPRIYAHKMIIANTCIWIRLSHKKLLQQLRLKNPNAELYYAKQEVSVDSTRILRHSTTIVNAGEFGFQTSLSERELFVNRGKGFEQALEKAFVKVSPILMVGE